MSLNSQYSFYPLQPDNPSDSERYFLTYHALKEKGRPEDFSYIMKLMQPPPSITNYARPGQFKGVRVGIIGGGLAGLASAFELLKLGFDITLYEALDNRIGGRVYTYYFDKNKNLYGEFGPMRIPVSHETVWHYINLFGLPTRTFLQVDNNAYVYLRDTRVRNDPGGVGVMKHIYPKYELYPWERTTSWQKLYYTGTESPLLMASPEVRSEILQVKAAYSEKTLLFSDVDNLKMMASMGLSQGAISIVTNFSTLLSGNIYNSYIDFIQEGYPADLSYLYEIPGGAARLVDAFCKSLTNADAFGDHSGVDTNYLGKFTLKPGCWVDGIHYDKSFNKIRLSYEISKSGVKVNEAFDYIVCAIPFSSLRNVHINPLFSNIKMRAIKEVNYVSAQKTLLLCKERFWEREGIVGGASYTDLPASTIWYPSDHLKYINMPGGIRNLPYNQPGVMTGSYSIGMDAIRLSALPEDKRMDHLKRQLELVHGLPNGYLNSIVEECKTVNWDVQPTFRGSLCFFAPGQKELFSCGMVIPEYNERVFFAGEHISAVHRWMQGALHSGMAAANCLANACKRHTKI
ncbi:flavin monoamine oxidase family protein [Pseudobacteroides cellulosolvens]|uniref:L-amino-acid oxidase n=1 Tax=Pseudobacteroides cellulosolvens ATCC 35603 = DSM 2933 TaxID=398512 RepID=A0A0L6JV18_9FIRM|nr:FAD-dependent oxidoreductase [Pseudobacteroides cellulosolvens]KNY29257.1 L-amino-acid oxidase [Pseudobacteroides cellulosolvens ATCC 35603 = DSM 2933]